MENRSCKFNEAPNCSIAQICEGQVCVFGRRLYPTPNTEIDYSTSQAIFYEMDSLHSLNQAPETATKSKVYRLPLNLAFEVFNAFEELDKLNLEKLQSMQAEG